MISIEKYGQNIDLTKATVVNGKKSFILENIDGNNTINIKVSKDMKFTSQVDGGDVKMEFKDKDGNIFELILKDLAQILFQNDGDKVVEISREGTNEILASITDINSALEAAAAGATTVATSVQTTQFQSESLTVLSKSYENALLNETQINTKETLVSLDINLNQLATVEVTTPVQEESTVVTTTLKGIGIDGYISGMTVFSDLDGDNTLDSGEASTLTTALGAFTLTGASTTAYVIGVGGTDISTNAAFEGLYKAPAGVTILNPVTTLISNLMIQYSLTQAQAESYVKTAFGIDTALSLTTDPIASSLGNSTYLTIQLINTIIENTVSQIATLGKNVAGTSELVAYVAASEALASLVFTGTDFTSDTLDLTSLVTSTISALGASADSTLVANLLTVISNTNAALESAIDGQTDATTALTNLAKTQVVLETIENSVDSEIASGSTSLTSSVTSSNTETIKTAAEDAYVANVTLEQASNEAPVITVVNPVLATLSEDDFISEEGLPNAYYIISEADVYAALGVTDADDTDGLSVSLITDSSTFSINGDITSSSNGVFQLTQADIDFFGLTGVSVGDFFVYSLEFDSLSVTDTAEVTFQVKAYDGSEYSSQTATVSVSVTGTNDLPVITVVNPTLTTLSEDDFQTLSGYPNAYYVISEADVYAALGITDTDANDGLSLSLITDSSTFSINGDITSSSNGVFQLTQADIDFFGLTGVSVGDFFVYSLEFNDLDVTDTAEVTFKVKAFDGTGLSLETATVSVSVTGAEEAPVISVVNPTLTTLSENDFQTLSGYPNAYYVISEADVYAALGVTDADDTDGLSVSLITDSSTFSINGDITSSSNGVFQLTQADIDFFGLTGVSVGDFFVYSLEFDSLSVTDTAEVTFQVKAYDGVKYSEETATVSVSVTGTNDLPVITVVNPTLTTLSEDDFQTLSGYPNAYYVISEADVYAALGITDTDANDGLSLSLITDSSTFSINGDITSSSNGVFQLTQADIDFFGLTGVSVGDFFVYSLEFNDLDVTDTAEVTFKVKAFDGTGLSLETATVSVSVTGAEEAPVISVVNPTLTTLSENDFQTLSGYPNAYYVISEADVYAALGVTDADDTDGLSVSLITDSSTFSINGDITSSSNGVFQLTQADIDFFGLTGVSVGDFFVYSLEFDSLSVTDTAEVTFQVKAYDGVKYSEETATVSVSVTGTNDLPVITVVNPTLTTLSEDDFQTLSGYPNAYYVISEADVYAALGVVDVDTNDELNLSLIIDSSTFTLNGTTDVTSGINGVFQLKQTDIDAFGLTGVSVGDFFVYSTDFDSMGVNESTLVSFKVVVNDGTTSTAETTVSVTVTGENDAPVVTVANPTLTTLSENDFQTLAGYVNSYYLISEADVYAALGVVDVDTNDELNVSLITDSSNFSLNGSDVTSSSNGIVQLTAQDIIDYGLTGTTAKVGDFFVYSTDFDSMGVNESTLVSFKVVVNDGTTSTAETTVSVTVTGEDELPIVAPVVQTIASNETTNEYVGLLAANYSEPVTYSINTSSVSIILSLSNIQNLAELVSLDNAQVKAAALEIQPALLNFISTGSLAGFFTLSATSISVLKDSLTTLREFYTSNTNLKDGIISLKEFIVENKDIILANSDLVATDLVTVQALLTEENVDALLDLYDALNLFLDNNPNLETVVKAILADNVISPIELASIDPVLLQQVNLLSVQIKSIVDSNEAILSLLNVGEVIAKLREIITIDSEDGTVSIEVQVDSTVAENLIDLDSVTGNYTILNDFIDQFSDLTDIEITFDYNVETISGEVSTAQASFVASSNVEENTTYLLDDNGVLSFTAEEVNIGNILDNASSNFQVEDIDSINLSSEEHILSNLSIEDFEAMVADGQSNTLSISGENDDIIKLDLSTWTRNESDTDLNSVVESSTDDGYIAYTAIGTQDQVLTLLIDKDITVQDI